MTDILISDHPSVEPPTGTAVVASRPDDRAAATVAAIAASAPSLERPSGNGTIVAAADAVAASWQTGVVDGLWSMDQTRNGRLRIVGLGWRKVFNGADFAYMAMMSLGAQSRATGSPLQFFVSDDGMIHSMYIW